MTTNKESDRKTSRRLGSFGRERYKLVRRKSDTLILAAKYVCVFLDPLLDAPSAP